MIRKLSKLRELSRREVALLLEAAVLLPIVAVALRAAGFARTRKLIERWGRARREQPAGDTLPVVSRMVRVAASHLPVKAGCLPQSLVAWCLLRRRGVACELRFGARRDGAGLLAHAWVELPDGSRFDIDLPGAYSAFLARRSGSGDGG